MFCFGLQSIARFINMNAPYFNTNRLEIEGNFSRNLRKKNKNVIHRSRSVRNGLRSRAVLKTSGKASPNTDLPASE